MSVFTVYRVPEVGHGVEGYGTLVNVVEMTRGQEEGSTPECNFDIPPTFVDSVCRSEPTLPVILCNSFRPPPL